MLKKIKELLGFPTDAEKAAAKPDAPKQFVDGHGDVREVVAAAQNVFAFPKSDKPEQEPAKPKAKRTPKPKAEAAAKAPAKKPAAKKPAAKKPAAKKASTPRKPKQAKAE